MNICLVVKVLNKNKNLVAAYAKEVDLPFVPTVGMKFKQGNRTLCGQSMAVRVYDKVSNRFINKPNYVETDELCICKKCLEIAKEKGLM